VICGIAMKIGMGWRKFFSRAVFHPVQVRSLQKGINLALCSLSFVGLNGVAQ